MSSRRPTTFDESSDLDFSARYSVDGYSGIAFYLRGYVIEYVRCDDDEGWYDEDHWEEIENKSMVRAIMVGDDREHDVDVSDLTLLADNDYCSQCGQIGCAHDGR